MMQPLAGSASSLAAQLQPPHPLRDEECSLTVRICKTVTKEQHLRLLSLVVLLLSADAGLVALKATQKTFISAYLCKQFGVTITGVNATVKT